MAQRSGQQVRRLGDRQQIPSAPPRNRAVTTRAGGGEEHALRRGSGIHRAARSRPRARQGRGHTPTIHVGARQPQGAGRPGEGRGGLEPRRPGVREQRGPPHAGESLRRRSLGGSRLGVRMVLGDRQNHRCATRAAHRQGLLGSPGPHSGGGGLAPDRDHADDHGHLPAHSTPSRDPGF